jgi:Rrf2 family iron-sulfur cluster assembly transcriptional regulator
LNFFIEIVYFESILHLQNRFTYLLVVIAPRPSLEIDMFSKLTQNAVNTMLWVCKHQDSGPVTTDIVSKRLGLSVSYLESVFSQLKKYGFVVSYRGPGGGYCTQSKPSDLMLLDLVKHFDFQEQTKQRTREDQGEMSKDVVSHLMKSFWETHLKGLSLADVMNKVPDDAWGGVPTSTASAKLDPRKFKPLQVPKLPSGPNSVFSLAHSLAA